MWKLAALTAETQIWYMWPAERLDMITPVPERFVSPTIVASKLIYLQCMSPGEVDRNRRQTFDAIN